MGGGASKQAAKASQEAAKASLQRRRRLLFGSQETRRGPWARGNEKREAIRALLAPISRRPPEKILKALAAKRADLLFDALQVLQEDGSKLGARHYTIGISSCARSRRWREACWLFGSMKVRPDLICLNAAISAFEKGAQWQQALSTFQSLPTRKLQPSAISFNATISSCEKARQWQHALHLFNAMPAFSAQPSLVSYNAAITSCEKGAQWMQAVCLFRSIPQILLQPDVISCNAVLSSCEKAAQWQQSLALYQSMPEIALQPDVISLNALISAFEKSAQWQWAVHIFEATEVRPDVVSFTALISSCEKAQLMDAVSSASALNACAKAAQWTRALHLFEKQESPNVIIYMSLLSSFCDQDLGYKSLTQLELHQHLLKLTPHVLEVEGLLPLQWWVSVIHPELRRVSPGLREASRMAAMRISRAGRAQLELRRRDLPVLRRPFESVPPRSQFRAEAQDEDLVFQRLGIDAQSLRLNLEGTIGCAFFGFVSN
ncbi:unnamed protein product [Effrenium voratum]|nr:unnamed protein product [Effrenium voratum]